MGSTQIPQLERMILERIREALEIKKAKYSKKIKVLNIDEGNLVKTNTAVSQYKWYVNVLGN